MRTEAEILGRYILGTAISPRDSSLYAEAVEAVFQKRPEFRQGSSLETLALRAPVLLPFLDAALALVRPSSSLRQRMIIMSAVLETNPKYCESFLPRDRSIMYAGQMALVAIAAGISALVGLLLLPFDRK